MKTIYGDSGYLVYKEGLSTKDSLKIGIVHVGDQPMPWSNVKAVRERDFRG